MPNQTAVMPRLRKFDEHDELPRETRQQNSDDRARMSGPGAELLRRVQVAHLRDHMEAFYEHGSLADVVALCAAFELMERGWRERAICERSLLHCWKRSWGYWDFRRGSCWKVTCSSGRHGRCEKAAGTLREPEKTKVATNVVDLLSNDRKALERLTYYY